MAESMDTGTVLHEDLAWSCPFPVAESAEIAGLISFYTEKVDLCVDGVLEDQPETEFSLFPLVACVTDA